MSAAKLASQLRCVSAWRSATQRIYRQGCVFTANVPKHNVVLGACRISLIASTRDRRSGLHNIGGDAFGGFPHRVAREMRIARGGSTLR